MHNVELYAVIKRTITHYNTLYKKELYIKWHNIENGSILRERARLNHSDTVA